MDLRHGKYLGVDYGDVRTGLAECDASGLIATGVGTLREGGMMHTAQRVARECAERGCVRIVVGLPKNMDGTEGERVKTVMAFIDLLRPLTDAEVVTYDERMSTMTAYRYLDATGTHGKRRKENIDTLSAQIILQDYIDKERNSVGK